MIETIFQPVVLRVAHRTICRVTLCSMVGRTVVIGLVTPNTSLKSRSRIPFVTGRALGNGQVRSLENIRSRGMVEK